MLGQLKAVAGSLHLWEVVNNGADFRFRLIGAAVFPGFKENLVGRLLREHPDKDLRLRFTALLQAACSSGAPVRDLACRKAPGSFFGLEIESLWLPFGTDTQIYQVLSLAAFKPVLC